MSTTPSLLISAGLQTVPVGVADGFADGLPAGLSVGEGDGDSVGDGDGDSLGVADGLAVGVGEATGATKTLNVAVAITVPPFSVVSMAFTVSVALPGFKAVICPCEFGQGSATPYEQPVGLSVGPTAEEPGVIEIILVSETSHW